MGQITAILTLTKTVATTSGATFQAVMDWIKTNVIDKLPADATVTVHYDIQP